MATGEIVFSDDETRIIRKIYLKNLEGRSPETIWFGKDVGTTRDAAGELKELFGGELPFDTPKPRALIRRMLKLAGVSDGDIVLDFFAGSGSTADAVLRANNDENVAARFILIQLPEPVEGDDYSTIAEITKQRVRRAAIAVSRGKNGGDAGAQIPHDRGFRVFALTESNFTAWDAEGPSDAESLRLALESQIDHIRDGWSDLDLLYEILLKSGYQLTVPVDVMTMEGKSVYSVDEGSLLVFLGGAPTLALIRSMASARPERVVMLDVAFAGNDSLKANAAHTFMHDGAGEDEPIVFRTI